MVSYFKEENYLLMAAGAAVCSAGTYFLARDVFETLPMSGKITLFVMPVLVGAAIGRVISALWCGRRILAMSRILFDECNPQRFIEIFTPVAARAPRNTIEFVDGRVRLAFAYEALGQFEQGLELLVGLHPEELRQHSLLGSAITVTQQARLQLLMGNRQAAEKSLDRIHTLLDIARQSSPSATSTLEHSVDLYAAWIDILNGSPSYTSLSWLRDEADQAGNKIHKAEMLLLLSRGQHTAEQDEKAIETLNEAATVGDGLWIGMKAKEILKTVTDGRLPHIPIY